MSHLTVDFSISSAGCTFVDDRNGGLFCFLLSLYAQQFSIDCWYTAGILSGLLNE